MQLFNRDISWLGFNYRVLQEAANEDIPLYERISFLSIFSSNLDEFFRVRYSIYTSLRDVDDTEMNVGKEIERIVNQQLPIFGKILAESILPALQNNGIHLHYNEPLKEIHLKFARSYFYTHVLTFLQPVILSKNDLKFELDNNMLYFLVELYDDNVDKSYVLVNIPHENLSRFVLIPRTDSVHHIVFLDDVIRYNLDVLFPAYKISNCYSIKLTRNADIDIVDEWSDLFEEEVVKMIKKREKGSPTRLLHEDGISNDTRDFLSQYFNLKENSIIQGGRYHNLKDLASLPNPVGKSLRYSTHLAKDLTPNKQSSIFNILDEADEMLHLPYHSYNMVLRFFNEAAIHPFVEEVSITLYRVASDSYITNALISAAKNGKKVTAFVELKARFDEENNLVWAKKMKEAGVQIVYSIPGMKVHAKVAIVKYKTELQAKYYSLLSTGNFNEKTARFYTDHILLTSNKHITKDVNLLFTYLKARQQPSKYDYINFDSLLVTGFNFLEKFKQLVEKEIENKKRGEVARIIIKLNNLEEQSIIELLYKASNAGVKIDLIIRGICCLVPQIKGMSENISVKRIVGRYLEHSRIFIFHNSGNSEIYLGSADMMNRNIHRRIEAIFPLYDNRLKEEIKYITDLHLKDNVQATILNSSEQMLPVESSTNAVNSQNSIYEYVNTIQ